MKISNSKIYQIADNFLKNFENTDIYIPAKINFFLQKNMQIITIAAQDIESTRAQIGKQYGEIQEDGSFKILEDKIEIAYKELEELFAIEQELDIKMLSIEDFGDIKFTPAQMQTIMFMIED